MRRRDFLKSAGCFVATASVTSWLGCGDEDGSGAGAVQFPQGIASGDPRPESVMLWTRALHEERDEAAVQLRVEVSETDDFERLVAMKEIEATRASDFTVRVLVEGLQAGKIYFYRFVAGAARSAVGRTRTAPALDADVEPRFAWVCCQDYESGFYGAYRQLLDDDAAKASEEEQLHFIMHLGDFIYETREADFMQPLDEDLEPIELLDGDGKPRKVPAFPSGGKMTSGGNNFAATVADYRHLYRTYLSDENLREARARWPFITVWDDHEFSNDCWQSQANYERDATTDEPSQKRRVAASQAWFEYTAAALSDAEPVGGQKQAAKDFEAVTVDDAAYSEVVDVEEPNNAEAIGAITIYRNLRWGKHLELVLTDSRSYRSDHAMAEEVTLGNLTVFHPRAALPKDAVNVMDAGRTANGGDPPDEVQGFENTRKDSPPGTLLGAAQKQWWKDVMKASEATFKVWGNPVPILRILLDRTEVALIPNDLVLSPDAWDGYNTERKELMNHLADNQISNVVSLSGDHHAHYAGVVYQDYDAEQKTPAMVDVVTAGISSSPQFQEVAGALKGAIPPELAGAVVSVRNVIYYDSIPLGGDKKVVVNLNTLIRYGSKAANVAAATHDLAKVEEARDDGINPHLVYADSSATGYGLAHVSADALNATLVTMERSFEDPKQVAPKVRARASFRIPKVDSPDKTSISGPEITGAKPFPLR
jgi:alkaline phosphatase D